MAYCKADDISKLLDDTVRQQGTSDASADSASNEIDSIIGFVYVTPIFNIALPESAQTVDRVVRLLLQKLASFIGAGRILMSMNQQGEDTSPNAYGLYLLQQAEDTLCMIKDGRLLLTGVPSVNPQLENGSRVVVSNIDPYSQVESFYNAMSRPTYAGRLGRFGGFGGFSE